MHWGWVARSGREQLLLLVLTHARACAQACQLATCTALADIYKLTYNASKPWREQRGWETTRSRSCRQLVAARGSAPPYCGWYGISCCEPASLAARSCAAVHAVTGVHVVVNALNASVSDSRLVSSLRQLHACGLTRLALQGNDLSGEMTDAWGQLSNLTELDLCKLRACLAPGCT